MSPLENVPTVNEETNPMLHLCLDSHDGVNLACKLTERFSYEIPEDLNPLVDDEQKRSRRVGEIVDLVCKLIGARKVENNG
jgi:hypothetical protein